LLLGLFFPVVLALFFMQFAFDRYSWQMVVLSTLWVLLGVAYLWSRWQDRRRGPATTTR
jgi:hypothetical protein